MVRLDLSGNNFDSLPDIIGGLSSLGCLDQSGYNFVSILDSITGLAPLKYLNLNGNNFDSLPNSISGLRHLKILKLCGCKRLQSFLELLFSLCFVDARSCTLPVLFNGFKLVDYIQSGIVFLALGSEIPKWFNNQRIGHKVNIQVPSCYGRHERMGIALCIVLVPNSAL